MFYHSTFVLLVLGFGIAQPNQKLQPLSDEYIQEINNKQSLWITRRNSEIDEHELFTVLASKVRKSGIFNSEVNTKISDDIPDSFDAREAWPECADIIGLIRDQSRCGSSAALAAVEVMSDRICIHSNATRKLLVSAQDLITCGTAGGCHGGLPNATWDDWEQYGIVTGGLYNRTNQGCKSYFLPPCDDHPNQCTEYVDTPDCVTTCDDSSLDYDSQKTYGKDFVFLQGEEQIQLEILKNGPVAATMELYLDFATYTSGIYQHTSEDQCLEGQAVKILGWGLENDVKYWLVANSWNEGWGENGFFRIIRGVDEVKIEDYITAGLPDFSRF